MSKLEIDIKDRVASFDVDCQNTFTPLCVDELPVPEGNEIVTELNLSATFAKYRVGSKDAHNPQAIWVANEKHPQFSPLQGENVDVYWRRHAEVGTKGFELIAGLPKVTQYDYFVWKGIELDLHPYGACYHDFAEKLSTGVIEFLKIKKISTVIVGGLATDYCVKNTVIQLAKAGFKVVVNLGASRGISPNSIETALSTMKNAGAILIDSANQLFNNV